MKTKYQTLLLLFPIILGSVSADAKIQSVELFADSATITRAVDVEFTPGENTLTLDRLPRRLNQEYLQVLAGDLSSFRILNFRFEAREKEEIEEAADELRDQQDAMQAELRQLQRKESTLQEELKFAQSIAQSFAKQFGEMEEGGHSLSVAQAKETWSYTQGVIENAGEAIEAIAVEKKSLQEDLKEIGEKIQEVLNDENLLSNKLILEIEATTALSTELLISYQVYGANWQPKYEVRAYPSEEKLNLLYQAQINQKTGEDWAEALLTLHTHSAAAGGNVPTLSPLIIQQWGGYGRSREMKVVQMAAPAEMEDTFELSAFNTTVASTTSSYSFTLPTKVTVLSQDEATSLDLKTESFETEFWSETVPKVSLEAYLRAKGTNTSKAPILPGRGLAFVDDVLAARIHLPKTLPEEELELSLGKDMNVLVQRREGSQKDKDSGFIDKTRTFHREFVTTVENRHNSQHKLVVVDQFPIAQDAKIEIERIAPKNDQIVVLEENEENGIFQWEFELTPKESKDLKTEYKVVAPRDWNLNPNF